MIKTTIVPSDNNIYLKVPNKYIGKQVNVLFYIDEELEEDTKKVSKKKASDYIGTISSELADEMQKYVEESSKEWSSPF